MGRRPGTAVSILATLLVAASFAARCSPPDPTGGRLPDEPWRVLLEVRDGTFTAHLGYEPADGGPRVRVLGMSDEIPWPAELPVPEWARSDDFAAKRDGILKDQYHVTEPRPAVLLSADYDEPWWGCLHLSDPVSDVWPSLYLADRRPDGSLAAFPFHSRLLFQLAMSGCIVIPDLMWYGAAIWITREGNHIRYRWGDRRLWTAGDVTLDDAALRLPKAGPVLPDLTRFMREHCHAWGLPVFLHAGRHVRYLDVLRAVECSGGDPLVFFLPQPSWKLDVFPPMFEKGDSALLRQIGLYFDESGGERRITVVVHPDGRAECKGNPLEPESCRELYLKHRKICPTVICVLRADEGASWSSCAPFARVVREEGGRLGLSFSIDDPGLGFSGTLIVPPPCDGAARVAPGPDAKAGEVFREVLRHLCEGAPGIRFE